MPELLKAGRRIDFAFIDGWHTFDYSFVDFFYTHKMLNVGGLIALYDATIPSVRKLARYILANHSYSVYKCLETYAQPVVTARRVLFNKTVLPLLKTMDYRLNILKPDVLASDADLGLFGRCIVLKKEAEDAMVNPSAYVTFKEPVARRSPDKIDLISNKDPHPSNACQHKAGVASLRLVNGNNFMADLPVHRCQVNSANHFIHAPCSGSLRDPPSAFRGPPPRLSAKTLHRLPQPVGAGAKGSAVSGPAAGPTPSRIHPSARRSKSDWPPTRGRAGPPARDQEAAG